MMLPDRKVLAGGISGLIAWALIFVAGRYGVTVDVTLQPAIVGAVTVLMSYIVPPSQRDIIKRLNDQLVQMAADDPNIPVSPR